MSNVVPEKFGQPVKSTLPKLTMPRSLREATRFSIRAALLITTVVGVGLGWKDRAIRKMEKEENVGKTKAQAARLDQRTGHPGYGITAGSDIPEKPNIDLGHLDLGEGVSCTGEVVFLPVDRMSKDGSPRYMRKIFLRFHGLPKGQESSEEAAVHFSLGVQYGADQKPRFFPKTFVSEGGFQAQIGTFDKIQAVAERNKGDSEKEEEWLKEVSRMPKNFDALQGGTNEENKVRFLAMIRTAVNDEIAKQETAMARQEQSAEQSAGGSE